MRKFIILAISLVALAIPTLAPGGNHERWQLHVHDE